MLEALLDTLPRTLIKIAVWFYVALVHRKLISAPSIQQIPSAINQKVKVEHLVLSPLIFMDSHINFPLIIYQMK